MKTSSLLSIFNLILNNAISIFDDEILNSNNLLSEYENCMYKPRHIPPGMKDFGAMYFGILTKELVYQHDFKAGGTTIQNGIKSLIDDSKMINLSSVNTLKKHQRVRVNSVEISQTFYNKQNGLFLKDIIDYIDDDALIFTFIRDPISKAMSAFFDLNHRARFSEKERTRARYRYIITSNLKGINSWEQYIQLDGVTAFEKFIDNMYENIKQRKSKNNDYQRDYYINAHLVPNLFFLMHNGQQKKSLPYNFIGNLKNLSIDLPKLLNKYLIDDNLKNNATLLMDQYFSPQRTRDKKENDVFYANDNNTEDAKYNLKFSQLKDDYIKKMCQIYWMDYLCFPSTFNLPSQCSLNHLKQKHLGIDLIIR